MTIYSLSGHVANPGQFEAPLGITLRQLLDLAGGIRAGHQLKFWTPGGSSTPMLTAEHLDIPLDYEGVASVKSMLGTKALQCFDETTSVVRTVLRWTEFYKHESCGKCTPCREGTWWLVQILKRMEAGRGEEGDIEKLLDLCENILGRSFCALGDGATSPISFGDPVLPRASSRRDAHPRLGAVPLREERPSSSAREFPHEERITASVAERTPTIGGAMTETRSSVSVRDDHGGFQRAARAGQRRPGHSDHRRHRGVGAEGHAGDPRRRVDRRRGATVLRSSAARSGRRLPAVPGRGARRWQRPADSQTAGVVHARGRARDEDQDPAHLTGGGQGPAREPGVPADQPPAGLPDLRQGRRVPAAEPGAVPRLRREPLHRRQAHLPQADQHLAPTCCWTGNAACSAPAAPGSPSRWPGTRSSR